MGCIFYPRPKFNGNSFVLVKPPSQDRDDLHPTCPWFNLKGFKKKFRRWYFMFTPSYAECVPVHYFDVIMGTMASLITSLMGVYSTVHSGAGRRKHQSSASLAFVRRIHQRPVNSPHKWSVAGKMFPFDDVIMQSACLSWLYSLSFRRFKDWTKTAEKCI